jgi:D-alanyl-D-alanine carboxypeptidase (penicillin-binding protein 5/6)
LKNVVLKHASAVLAALTTAAFGLAFAQGAQPSPQPAAPKPAALSDALPIPPAPAPKSAAAWILIDYATGQVLAGENYDARREPASITKVMTSYVIAVDMGAGKF